MVDLALALKNLRPVRALVLGDFLLDTYITGRVRRISPEAPVPLLEVFQEESRPGGAGNTVLNLLALGAKVAAVGRVGSDPGGFELKERLLHAGANVDFLLTEEGYQTSLKKRLIAEGQQLMRIDFERMVPLQGDVERQVLLYLEAMIPTVQVIAFSDYGKGFLSRRIIEQVMQRARECKIPVIIDPKGNDFSKYRGATLLKPNLFEAYAAARLTSSATLDEVADQILHSSDVEFLLITRSEEGMSLFNRNRDRTDFPVHCREVKDVTGAGDTVLAMISLGMANRLELSTIIPLANIAAGIAIERIGCAQVKLAEIEERVTPS